MSQHDYDIADASGATVRGDINSVLAAAQSNNSGAAEPTTKVAFMWWYDTTNGVLKIRNAANTAWEVARNFMSLYQVDTGTADAMVITPSPAVTAYVAGQVWIVKKAASNNTGAATLKVSALTPIAIKDHFGNDLTAGDLQGSEVHHLVYNGTNFVLMGFVRSQDAVLESGTAMLFYQAAAPTGWTKDASATDQLIVLKEDDGGVAAGTLSPITGTPETTELDGEHDHGGTNGTALSIAQLAAHPHDVLGNTGGGGGGLTRVQAITGQNGAQDLTVSGAAQNNGSGSTHVHTIPGSGTHSHAFGLLDFKRRHVILATKD